MRIKVTNKKTGELIGYEFVHESSGEWMHQWEGEDQYPWRGYLNSESMENWKREIIENQNG